MLRALLLAVSVAAPVAAFAAPPLRAEVLLVVPDKHGPLPAELQPMRAALTAKGYAGAHVEARRDVVLHAGRATRVDLGRKAVDLELVSVGGDEAQVRMTPAGQAARVTTVNTTHTRFFVTVPR